MIGSTALFSGLSTFVSRYYNHPAYLPIWTTLEGRAIQVHIQDVGTWMLTITVGKLIIHTLNTEQDSMAIIPTMTVSGPFRAFLRLAGTRDVPQAKKLGLCVTGDLTLALSLAHAFKQPPIDATERLSAWVGDHAAVRLTQWGKGLYQRLRQGPRQLAGMTTEYLQFESLLLPSAPEVEDWMKSVDTLRDDVERLAARLDRLNVNPELTPC